MSLMPRIVARLDVRGDRVIKGVRFEGRRVVGDPHELAVRYYEQGADEIIYFDAMAALCGHNALHDIISKTADDVFVPLTVSGGIRSAADVREALLAGADKVCVNTAAVADERLISELARIYGSSTIAVSIDCKRHEHGWEVMTDYGRESSGKDAVEWAFRCAELGAGEIVATSIDADGTMQGLDVSLVEALDLPISLVVGGGCNTGSDAATALHAGADAVSIASLLHYGKATIGDVKSDIEKEGIPCRR